ncbi:MAG TPA: recombinase family protein [Gaiellaceae bacterium]
MSRRRQQRRADKARRHLRLAHDPTTPVQQWPQVAPSRVVIREASYVERLAYTRSQAAQVLGISRSTLRRLLPYVDTIEMPWGGKLIPVDELERLAVERRRTARPRLEPATRGRKPAVPLEIAKRIRDERFAGKSLRQIAADLNADRIPTAHGGKTWWPSTVRGVLQRLSP